MPVQTQSLFDSGHQDQIHDCQLDYYGRVSQSHHAVLRDNALMARLLEQCMPNIYLTIQFLSCLQRLATCSSDRVIKIFEVTADSRTHLADLTGHEGPVRVAVIGSVKLAHQQSHAQIAHCASEIW